MKAMLTSSLKPGWRETPQQAIDFLMLVWKPGLARAKEELADMQALVTASGGAL